MPRYLSPEWVQAYNDALAGLDIPDILRTAGAGSFTALQGTFAVTQVITGVPPGTAAPGDAGSYRDTVRLVLAVDNEGAALVADPAGALPSNVTIVLTYVDAIAIARGELDPGTALAAGRVRIRGELAVLVAGQAMLSAAAAALGRTPTDLTDASDLPDPDDTTDPGE